MKIEQKLSKDGSFKNLMIISWFFKTDPKYPSVVKVEMENLTKIPTDPFSEFLGIIKKLMSVIHSKDPVLKNDFRKYCVDLFYNNLFLSKSISINTVKSELHKVIFYF